MLVDSHRTRCFAAFRTIVLRFIVTARHLAGRVSPCFLPSRGATRHFPTLCGPVVARGCPWPGGDDPCE